MLGLKHHRGVLKTWEPGTPHIKKGYVSKVKMEKKIVDNNQKKR